MDPEGNGEGEANAARGVVSDAEAEAGPVHPQGQGQVVESGDGNAPAMQQQQNQAVDPPQHKQHQPNPEGSIQPYQQPHEGPFAQHQMQQMVPCPPSWHPTHMNHPPPPPPPPPPGGPPQQQQPPPPPSQHAIAMAQYYEARMRDHAAAYASAAAGAAWAAAQIAAQAAEFAACTHANSTMMGGPGPDAGTILPPPIFDPNAMPPSLPMPPAGFYQDQNNGNNCPGPGPGPPSGPPMMPIGGGPPPNNFHPGPNGPDNGNSPWQNQQRSNDNPWHNSLQHQDNNNNNFNYDGVYATRNNRRKRTQRRPPGGISIPRKDGHKVSDANVPGNNNAVNVNAGNNQNSRVRRRLRDQGDSSNSSCATSITSYNSDQAMGGSGTNTINYGGHRSGNNYGNQPPRPGGRGGNHYHRYKKRMKQPRDDTSLLGKTGVSALYEWCGKRRMQPSFAVLSPLNGSNVSVEAGKEFEMAVYLEDGVEWGRGCGPSKNSAKQDAARKALQALVPGVLFDVGTGALVELPTLSNTMGSPSHADLLGHLQGHNNPGSLEDLAPHLAQRLAIAPGRDDDNEDGNGAAARGSASLGGTLKRRAWNVYPGTNSTTNSEEDDENAYYASRGASVCSVLLHAMVQIDDRIPEAPQYIFEVSKVPTANSQMKRKGPASSGGGAIVIQRGPFTCTATLKVVSMPPAATVQDKRNEADETEATADTTDNELGATKMEEKHTFDQDIARKGTVSEVLAKDFAQVPNPTTSESLRVLSAVGVGGTKRESKHTASAKLLALLFPECKTMVEVKAAAEAVREEYAASKSRSNTNASNRRRQNRRDGRSKIPRLSLSSGISQLNATDQDPPLPAAVLDELRALLGVKQTKKSSTISCQVASFQKLNLNQDSSDTASKSDPEVDAKSRESNSTTVQDAMYRPFSRRKQLDAQADKALAALNEHDEEGRSLPDELTVDDVGRTVLRRAEPEDIDRIRRLLSCHNAMGSSAALCPASILGAALVTDNDASEGSKGRCGAGPDQDDGTLRLWGSSTIVLLLCRAIAPEDPPLGCAVLTLGFSMQKGRLLRLAQLGSEPHLPRERFLECLEAFASCMQASLERQEPEQRAGVRLNKDDLKAVLETHLQLHDASPSAKRACDRNLNANISAPLQSVLEESEGGDDSDRPRESNSKVKSQDKPCKRSRVE